MKLADLAYPEVAERISGGAIALWPSGATEAHGPHLPLGTDMIIAEETCRRVASALENRGDLSAVVLPPLAFTVTEMARPFAGTISLPRETALAYVRDVLLGVSEHGFRAICVVNAHLEPAHRFVLRDAVKAASAAARCPIILSDPADKRWAQTVTAELASGSCHAGQYETSLVLAAARAAVREDARRSLGKLDVDLVARIKAGAKNFAEAGAPNAYCGDPGAATIEEGESSFQRLVEITLTMIDEGLKR